MTLDSAKSAVLALLRDKGRATNSALLAALGQAFPPLSRLPPSLELPPSLFLPNRNCALAAFRRFHAKYHIVHVQ
jgi:hypothetical protein